MPLWRYEATDRSGNVLRGVVDAGSGDDAALEMTRRGYRDVRVLGAVVAPSSVPKPSHSGAWIVALPADCRALFFRQMAALLRAGYTPAGALADLGPRSSGSRLRAASERMSTACASGASLSSAMAAEGGLFPDEVRGLVAVGEAGGLLPMAMDEAALAAELEIAVHRGMGWVRFLIWQSIWSVLLFVPIFPSIDFAGVGKSLANYGRALAWVVPLGIGMHLAWEFHVLWSRTASGARWRDMMANLFPATRRLARARALASFTRVLQALLASGVSPVVAFSTASSAIPESRFRIRMARGTALLSEGKGLDEAFAATGMFDDRWVQLLTTGQRTGTWTEMLAQGTASAQDELHAAVDAARSWARRVGILLTLISMGYVTIAGTHGSMQFALRFADTLGGP
jgi:general secretion pathway protein F